MSLMFNSESILERNKALTFGDVLLLPRHSEINSRHLPSLKTKVTKNFDLDMPIVSANMDTVTEAEMAKAMGRLGGLGVIHRFISEEEQAGEVEKVKRYFSENNIKLPVAASVGVKEAGMKRAEILAKAGVNILTIDIAHGDSIMMLETLEFIKKEFPHIDIIAGNVASGDGAKRLIDAGADSIKVGIGPGSMCTTRLVTGCGVPQLTAIALVYESIKDTGVPIIADGGIKYSGDMVKSFAAGANSVMVGSLLAGTLETPGEVQKGMKAYRGMASKSAQVSWRGGVADGLAPEGESTTIACKGTVEQVINELTGGIKSGMTYLNALEISTIKNNALFMEMSAAGFYESKPHGV